MREGGGPRVYAKEALEALASKPVVRRWLGGLADTSEAHSLYALNRFVVWRQEKGLNADPDAWIQECEAGTVRTLKAHLQTLQDWVMSTEFEGSSRETRRKAWFRIRGLYEANMVPLPAVKFRAPGNGVHQVRVETTATEFLGMVKRVLSSGHLTVRDRSVILVMLQSGMDASTCAEVFNVVGYPQLVSVLGEDLRSWDVQKAPVRIDLVRPKSDYRFYSFLDVDAIEALKEWLSFRERFIGPVRIRMSANPNALPESDPIWTDQYSDPLKGAGIGHIFRDGGKRAGVNVYNGPTLAFKGARVRFPFHSHEVRDTLRTLARGKADVAVAEFCIGHSIDKLHYDKSPWNDPEYFRREYLKISRPWLNPISGSALQVRYEVEKDYTDRLNRLEKEMAEILAQKQVASTP